MKLTDRYLNVIYPSKAIPTRYDQPLDDINIHYIKSGIGNKDDCKTLDITISHGIYYIEAHPVLYPGYFLIKSADHFLFPSDSIQISEPTNEDTAFYYYKMLDNPYPGMPIIFNIYKRNKNKYIEAYIKFKYRAEFTKKVINGVEQYYPEAYEFTITQNNEIQVLKNSVNSVSKMPTVFDANDIRQHGDFLGQGQFNSNIITLSTEFFPIKNVRIFTIDNNDNIKEWHVVRSFEQLDYSTLTEYNYVQVSTEFGIVTFGNESNQFDIPSVHEKIYACYNVVPHIEYIPEFSSLINVPTYLDITPAATGVNQGIVQISASDATDVYSLKLRASYHLEDQNALIYGPIEVFTGSSLLKCTAYNIYQETVPGIEITWHMDIDMGEINNMQFDETIKTQTNGGGYSIATYTTPNNVRALEHIFFRNETDYTINGNDIIFNNIDNIYKLEYCQIFTNHNTAADCAPKILQNYRFNSMGRALSKCVIEDDITHEKHTVHPFYFDKTNKQLYFKLEQTYPWYYYKKSFNEYISTLTEEEILYPGFVLNNNDSIESYHMLVFQTNITPTTLEPSWNYDLCSKTEITNDEYNSYFLYVNGAFDGWTVYTDALVKIYCTAKNKLTGMTIKSNNIYMHVTIPFSMLGLHGFRFDTIPESLMDKDPLTI